MEYDRKINVEKIDLAILKRGWGLVEAAARIGIDHKTLNRIYKTATAKNMVIIKISKKLDIPIDQLVIWSNNPHDPPAR